MPGGVLFGMRRACTAVLVLLGLALGAGVASSGSLGKAQSGQRLLDGARPTLSDAGLRQLRSDFDTLDRGLAQTVDEVFPAIADDLGVTASTLQQLIVVRYPATAAFLERRSEVTDALGRTVSNLEANQADFRDADGLPAPGVPLIAAPIAAIVIGIALIGLAGWAWRRPAATGPWAVAAGIGVLAVVATLALQVPNRAVAAEAVLGSLRITPAAAATTRDQFEVTKAATTELRSRLLADVAGSLDMSPSQFDAVLAQRFPAASAAFTDADALLGRIELDVRFRERVTGDFAAVRTEPLQFEVWLFIGFATVLTAVGLLGGGLPGRVARAGRSSSARRRAPRLSAPRPDHRRRCTPGR